MVHALSAIPLLLFLSPSLAIAGATAAAYAPLCESQALLWMVVTWCICEPCARCHFDWLRLECAPLPDASTAASNTASMPFLQPSLSPEDWFLTDEELTASRGGEPRRDLQAWSNGNDVDIFTTTDGFFSSVYRDVEALKGPGQIFFTGWEVTNVPFLPQSAQFEQTRFQPLMGRALDRGVSVHALVWTNLFHPHKTSVLQSWMNSHPDGAWLFDDRLPYLTSSHHQKTIVLASSSPSHTHPVTYVGGIDLTQDRWDTHFHNATKLRHLHGISRSYDGWIDASLRLRGPVVRDVAANFVSRWNDDRAPLSPSVEFSNPQSVPKLESLAISATPSNESVGTMSVQLTRTYSCKDGDGGYPFAPNGEVSILKARLKAIRQAKNYIYIEDQYFIHVPQLQEALLEVLPRIQALVIVTQEPPLSTSVAGYEVLLYRMLQPLLQQSPSKVFAFAPRVALDLYVHSKVVIIDDVFLSVGSANWNRRSMTSDSEVTANVVDRTVVEDSPDGVRVAAVARTFRLRKFSEFSGIPVEILTGLPFMDAVRALDKASASILSDSIVSELSVSDAPYFNVYPSGFEDQVDPEDLCTDL